MEKQPENEEIRGWFLVGPTASGKSGVAHLLAERWNVPILSADAMAVYRQMDVGTDKPTADMRKRVHYEGIDLADPSESFSVGRYLSAVREKLTALAGPYIVVGGTGLYISALLYGLDPMPPEDPSVRAEWEAVLSREGPSALREALRARAPELLAAMDDPDNPRRLIRALEWAAAGVRKPPETWNRFRGRVLVAGIRRNREELAHRIERRVHTMYARGLLEEARRLLERPGGLSKTARMAIGYAEAFDVLAGRSTLEEAMMRTIVRTRRLAKRQRTWFAHQVRVEWVDVTETQSRETIADNIAEVWERSGPVPIRL